MAIVFNNGVANVKGMPAMVRLDVGEIPPDPATLAAGTVLLDSASNTLFWCDGVSYYVIGGGGGSTPSWDATLGVNSVAFNHYAKLQGASLLSVGDGDYYGGNASTLAGVTIRQGHVFNGHYYNVALSNIIGGNVGLTFEADLAAGKKATITQKDDGTSINNQYILIAEDDGTLALQDPPFIIDITTNYTPDISKECIFKVSGTSVPDITLDTTKWPERKRVTFLFADKGNFISSTTIYGNTLIPAGGGLIDVMFYDGVFFINHI